MLVEIQAIGKNDIRLKQHNGQANEDLKMATMNRKSSRKGQDLHDDENDDWD